MWNWLKYFFRGNTKQSYKPVILVTGCSTGIGLALAKLLHKQKDYRVVVTAREESLDKITLKENERFIKRALDVKVGEQRQRLFSEIKSIWDGVDILVNNAGISYRAVVEHMDEAQELHQLRTNYLSAMAMIRLALPYMREKGRGKIINVSSVSGMLAMPTMSSYSASKYALEGASESMWYEMKPLGIDVTLVQPGFVRSQSFKNVYYSEMSKESQETKVSIDADDIVKTYSDYYKNMVPFIENRMRNASSTAEDVAKVILKVVKKRRPPLRVPATFDAVLFYYLRRLIPRRIFHYVLYWALPNARSWAEKYSKSRDRS